MGVLVSCEGISVEFPTRHVLNNVTLGVNDGDRVGVVGRNGDGKSTLLNVLCGRLEPDGGSIVYRRGVRVGMLAQKDSLADDDTVEHAVVGDLPTHEWAGDPAVREVIDALIGDIAWDARVDTLSGGQRRRCDLARLLIGDWDLLALDEPTNHLDMRAITWLASYLNKRMAGGEGALVVVTHDRWFLDEVCLAMWEVHDGTVDPFEGGYSAYIQQRVERDRQAAVTEERRQNLLRKELAWLARGPQARGTKPKFRIKAAKEMIADVPELRDSLELKRLAVTRLGKQVYEFKDVSARLGDTPVIDHVDWIVGPGDRIAILGANGAGKTTLLRLISGDLAPTGGRIKVGQTVKCAALTQRLDELMVHTGRTVREVLNTIKRRYTIDGKEYTPAQLLEQLGFRPGQQLTRVEELSGGQQRRLQLLLVLLSEPNVLILDEPGNDMDTDMLAVLEDLLDSWPGTLILVSHDRYLVERVTDNQYVLMDGKVVHEPRGVDGFLEKLAAREAASRASAKQGTAQKGPANQGGGPAGAPSSTDAPSGLSRQDEYRLRKQLASVERKMESLDQKSADVVARMHAVEASDFEELGRLQKQLDELAAQKDELEMEWLELTEQLEG